MNINSPPARPRLDPSLARLLIAPGLLLALAGVMAASEPTPPSPVPIPASVQADSAFQATLARLLTNSAAPTSSAAAQRAASNLLVILNPDLAQRDVRQSPAFRQTEAAAAATFSNPGRLHAERMEDPVYRQQYQAAMATFVGAGKKAKRPVLPTATDSAQIQALRLDPTWRQQREAPIQALLQRLPPPADGGR